MERVERLHDEHKEIRSLLEELGVSIEAPDETDRNAFIGLLRRLCDDLRTHFEFEEKGGLFTDIVQQRPSLDRKVAHVLHQHVDLRAQFDAVIKLAESGKSIAEVGPPLRDAMAALRTHERLETDLVQEAMLTDLGTGD